MDYHLPSPNLHPVDCPRELLVIAALQQELKESEQRSLVCGLGSAMLFPEFLPRFRWLCSTNKPIYRGSFKGSQMPELS